jgi:colanic acid/amylovoran biosynthesis glycosyltransferase
MTLHIAYLLNQYPKVSHSFIRREVQALERQGVKVQRIAVRGWKDEVVDQEDLRERSRTRYVLLAGIWGLVLPTLHTSARLPIRFFAALLLALRMARRADRSLPYHLIYLAQACQVLQWTRQSGATHLHAHFGSNPAEVAMLVRALGGPPYSFTVHGPEEFDKARLLHLREKIRHAAFVVAVSSYGRSQLYRWAAQADWPKVEVVHCGLEPRFYADAPSLAPGAPTLVCVGRLCEQKGQLLLVQAAQCLAGRGVPFELVLVGDGEDRARLEETIIRLGLRDRVRITGWVDSDTVRRQILAARALVLPSFAEGLPVVIMEAMALRRPVIATYVAGIPELVRPAVEGWLVPAGDVEQLANAMQECLAYPIEGLVRMGEAARQRVLSRHDVDTQAARLAEAFRRPSAAGGA